MFLILLTAFWGTKLDESLKYLREITTKSILFTVYKQLFHKMPVWTQILLWPVHIQKCLYQTKCGLSHTMKCLAPRLHLAMIKAALLNECQVYQLCVASPESRWSLSSLCLSLTLSHTEQERWWLCSALLRILDNCFHWPSSNSVLQMSESSVGCFAQCLGNWVTISHFLKPLYSKGSETSSGFKVLGSQFDTFILCADVFFSSYFRFIFMTISIFKKMDKCDIIINLPKTAFVGISLKPCFWEQFLENNPTVLVQTFPHVHTKWLSRKTEGITYIIESCVHLFDKCVNKLKETCRFQFCQIQAYQIYKKKRFIWIYFIYSPQY